MQAFLCTGAGRAGLLRANILRANVFQQLFQFLDFFVCLRFNPEEYPATANALDGAAKSVFRQPIRHGFSVSPTF